MNVEIGTEAAQLPEKEYIDGISLQCSLDNNHRHSSQLASYLAYGTEGVVRIYTVKKKVHGFPVPSRNVTNQTPAGQE